MKAGDQVLTFVSDDNINWIMDKSDIKERWTYSRTKFAYNQSTGGKLDFNYNYTLPSQGIIPSSDQSWDYDNVGGFMIMGDPAKANKAYNLNDGGQWLWGHAMKRLGFGAGTALNSASLNSKFTTGSYDTDADQNAIGQGFIYNVGTTKLSQGVFKEPGFNHRRDNRDDTNLLRKTDRSATRL